MLKSIVRKLLSLVGVGVKLYRYHGKVDEVVVELGEHVNLSFAFNPFEFTTFHS